MNNKNKTHLNYALLFLLSTLSLQFFCTTQPEEFRSEYIINGSTVPYMEIREGDSVTIFWDPPTGNTDSISYYQLQYSLRQADTWTVVKDNIPTATSPTVVIKRSELPSTDSVFNFKVCSVLKSGEKSEFHSSSDPTATPPGGWVLLWKAKI